MIDAPNTLPQSAVAAVLSVAALTAVFAFKHLAADFLLQTTWMARGKERSSGWALPLLAHVACHAGLTLLIALVVAPRLWWLAIGDLAVHTVIDRCKTLVAHRGAWRPDQPEFWWLLGVDQCLHQVTNIALAAALVLL